MFSRQSTATSMKPDVYRVLRSSWNKNSGTNMDRGKIPSRHPLTLTRERAKVEC
jgi:hypothetical protein